VQLGEFLEEPTSRPDIIQSARVFIAKLISGGGTDQEQAGSSISPAFAGLRGEEDEPFIYQVGNVQIVIDIQDDVEQIGHKTILGLVTGSESKEFIVQVSQEDQIIATSSVDEIGNFVITQLMPGDYEIVLEDSEGEIHIQSIQVI
jgi:hypothetical protein